jgi:pyruvate ferredoxin oxidoreductase alpha subunit
MVCVDGFVLTHAFEPIDVLTPEQVDAFLPPFAPRQVLDPADPLSIGAMVGPEAYTEVRYLSDLHLRDAGARYPRLAAELQQTTGRALPAWEWYGPADAELVVVAMGSVSGTAKEAVDAVASDGTGSIALLTLTLYRPFPTAELRPILINANRVLVIERACAPGADGPVSADLRSCLADGRSLVTVIAGLGGRAVTTASLARVLRSAERDELDERTFLDLRSELVEAELARRGGRHDSGPHALNVLRAAGIPASRIS